MVRDTITHDTTVIVSPPSARSRVHECDTPNSAWLFCDDFESDRRSSYFEYDERGGSFVRRDSVGVDGSWGMRAHFAPHQVNAGSIKLAFGKTPSARLRSVDSGRVAYREVYWRFYVRNDSGWTGGGGDKLTRAQSLVTPQWAQAMAAHVWSGRGGRANWLMLDPASGTDQSGALQTVGYNDFAHLRWLGTQPGRTPIFDSWHTGKWHCVETHVRLNDPGASNGVFELWVDGELDGKREWLNWVGVSRDYGINVIFVENYWNDGAPVEESREIDNLVVSTGRIGCGTQQFR